MHKRVADFLSPPQFIKDMFGILKIFFISFYQCHVNTN
jgi:hypothetical protein